MDVSVVTINRLEGGIQKRLTTKMADKIAGLLDESDIKELNPADPEEAKIFKSYQYLNKLIPALEDGESEKEIMTQSVKENLLKHTGQLLAKLDFEKYRPASSTNPSCCEEYYINLKTNKIWVINAYKKKTGGKGTLLSDFLCGLGKIQTIKKINKYSFAVPNSILYEIQKELEGITICNPLCDISILHYANDGTIDGEIDFALLKDGRGVFDFDSQDAGRCKQAIDDYTRWKLSVTKAANLSP